MRIPLLLVAWLFGLGWTGEVLGAGAEAGSVRPVVLYSLRFQAPGENRYPPDGSYRMLMDGLRRDFEVRAHDHPLTDEVLAGVKVLFISNPNDQAVGTNAVPVHMTRGEAARLGRFVERGGGLIVMENQENHNLEVKDMNLLLGRFGIRATNLYTDFKRLSIPTAHPVLGGLRWGFYAGNALELMPSHPARPTVVVQNDASQPLLKGTRDHPGVLMAMATPGRGRVVVGTDAGWLCDWSFDARGINGFAITGQDNREIALRLFRWAAGR